MTISELYRKHKNNEVSREKFLYEVRRDNNLPFITNLTSYNDAVQILKNKSIINEVDTKEAKAAEAVKAEVKAKAPSTKKPKELHIDYVNPYEYRHGLTHELEQIGEYTDEALAKAKSTVLKNLAKDVNFYSTLLNQKQSHYEFKTPETDAPGMQAKADGHLKKEAKKDEKANVQDSLGKKEAGKKKPKGIKIMPDKGVTGSEKTIKEGFEVKQANDQIEISDESGDYAGFVDNGKASFSVYYDEVDTDINDNNWKDILGPNHAFVKIINTIGGDVEAAGDYIQITVDADKLLNSNIKEGAGDKANKYISVEIEGNEQFPILNKTLISDYLKSVIDPEEIESVDSFMNDEEGFDESSSYFFDNDEEDPSEKDVEDWAKQEMSYYLFSKPDEFPGKEMNEHHNDPNFPGGKKIYAMLDKVADEWGKDSDLYSDLEDAITGWSDRNGELSPKGKIAIKALLSNWDILDDYEQFLDDTMEEGSFMGSEDTDNYSNVENQFNQLMSKYDWYYEMSDDPRAYDRGSAIDDQLRSLGKQIGADKATALFNAKAPSDRKVTSSFFMEGKEDKHAKLKELLKTKVKEAISAAELITAKQKGQIVKIPKSATTDIQAAERAKANYSIYE